jgi:putative addiction module killer protein
MYEALQASVHAAWFGSLRDKSAKGRIVARIERVQLGNLGDTKSVGGNVHEMRMDFGPGNRVYFTQRGERIILLLCGGDKGSQSRGIARAKQIASELE